LESVALTPQQALYVLDSLVSEKRLKPSALQAIAREMDAEVRELERRLAALRGDASPRRSSRSQRRTNRATSPETMRSRRIQGQYLGLVRQVPARERLKFRKIALEEGREAAIRALRVSLSK
jgi:hypothetical protein